MKQISIDTIDVSIDIFYYMGNSLIFTGKDLQIAIKQSGKSIDDVAAAMGISRQRLYQIIAMKTLTNAASQRVEKAGLTLDKGKIPTDSSTTNLYSIPFYEVTAMGGSGRGFPDDITPHQLITLPHRLQADVCILVGGDSMAPAYTPGDVIALRKVRGEHIHYGSAYMIETEDGCLLKYIRKASQDTHVRLVSENPAYDAYDIPKDAITGLWLVVGVWKRKEL